MRSLILLLLALLAPLPVQAQTVMPSPYQTTLDNSGRIINGACVWTYVAGSTTPAATYTDTSLGTPNANPIKSDSAGRFVAYLTNGASYKFVYENIPCSSISHGAVLKTVDNVSSVPNSNVNLDVTGTAGETITAGSVAYLSDGSGALVAGEWYNASSTQLYASSRALEVGVAVSGITSGSSGSFRVEGRVTGLTALVTGTRYYIAATAGTISATSPVNSRFVGSADSGTSLVIAPNPATSAVAPSSVAEGRLTATTATPVTTGDVSAATSIFYTPFRGNRIALYDGTNWNIRTFTEIAISVTACTASKPYDIFILDTLGVVTAEQLVWTSTTARATALTLQDGILVKTGALTRRYVGTYFCNASGGQTDDTFAKRYVWNYYNRVERILRRLETTASWSYTLVAFQQANAAAANQVETMIGVAEVGVNLRVMATSRNSAATASAIDMVVAIGLDSTTAAATGIIFGITEPSINDRFVSSFAYLNTYPAVGLHKWVWLESSTATGATTWIGTSGPNASGMDGVVWG